MIPVVCGPFHDLYNSEIRLLISALVQKRLLPIAANPAAALTVIFTIFDRNLG